MRTSIGAADETSQRLSRARRGGAVRSRQSSALVLVDDVNGVVFLVVADSDCDEGPLDSGHLDFGNHRAWEHKRPIDELVVDPGPLQNPVDVDLERLIDLRWQVEP